MTGQYRGAWRWRTEAAFVGVIRRHGVVRRGARRQHKVFGFVRDTQLKGYADAVILVEDASMNEPRKRPQQHRRHTNLRTQGPTLLSESRMEWHVHVRLHPLVTLVARRIKPEEARPTACSNTADNLNSEC